jgi:hypothetical protein
VNDEIGLMVSDSVLKRTTEIFATRLQTLAGLLDAAETQWRGKAAIPKHS